MNDPRFSASYTARKQKELQSKQKKEEELQLELKHEFDDKIDELNQLMGTWDIGEGGKDNGRLKQIERDLCLLKTGKQNKWLEKSAEINNYYMRNMERLLNQELQERLFWYTISTQSLTDPTPVNYDFYVNYLHEISRFEALYPTIDLLSMRCDADFEPETRLGKLQQWEREHCEVSMGFDVVIAGGKFDCSGFTVFGDFKVAELTYSRNYEPVFWETTSHSLTVKVGVDKEFAVGKGGLGGKIGVSGESTLKVDVNMDIQDWELKGGAGASINDGIIGKLGADIGSVSISANGGFNKSGPGFTSFGSSFLK